MTFSLFRFSLSFSNIVRFDCSSSIQICSILIFTKINRCCKFWNDLRMTIFAWWHWEKKLGELSFCYLSFAHRFQSNFEPFARIFLFPWFFFLFSIDDFVQVLIFKSFFSSRDLMSSSALTDRSSTLRPLPMPSKGNGSQKKTKEEKHTWIDFLPFSRLRLINETK